MQQQQSYDESYGEPEPPRKPENRAFIYIAGGLGALILVFLLCLGGWYICVNQGMCGGTDGPTTQAPRPPADATTVVPVSITTAPPIIITDTPFTDTPFPPITITLTTPPPSETPTYTPTDTPTITPTFTMTGTPSITPTLNEGFFDGFPPEYRDIQLPSQIVDILHGTGYVIPLPANAGTLQKEMSSVTSRFKPERFDFSRIVDFSIESNRKLVAVPVSAAYYESHYNINEDFSKGILVGLLYDKDGVYNRLADVYEVWAYEDHVYLSGLRYKSAILLQQSANEYVWVPQNSSSSLPLTAFVKNGCWLCWRLDKRCGCLICK